MNETHLERIGTVLIGINYEMWCVFMFKMGEEGKKNRQNERRHEEVLVAVWMSFHRVKVC